MDALWTMVALAATGVTYDWQPVDDARGGVEYIVQVEPELLEAAQAGQLEAIESNIPQGIGPVRRIRVVLGGKKTASEIAGEGGKEHSVLKPATQESAWPPGASASAKRHTVKQSGGAGQQPITPFTSSINNAAGQLEQGFQQAQNGFQQAGQSFTNAQNNLAQQFGTPAAPERRTIGGELLRGANELREGTRNVLGNTAEAIQGTAQNARDGFRSVLTGGNRGTAPAPAAPGSGQYTPYSYQGNAAATSAPPFNSGQFNGGQFNATLSNQQQNPNLPAPGFVSSPQGSTADQGFNDPNNFNQPGDFSQPSSFNQPNPTQQFSTTGSGANNFSSTGRDNPQPFNQPSQPGAGFANNRNQFSAPALDSLSSNQPGTNSQFGKSTPPAQPGLRDGFASSTNPTGPSPGTAAPFIPLEDPRSRAGRDNNRLTGDGMIRVQPTSSTSNPNSGNVNGGNGPTGPLFANGFGDNANGNQTAGFGDWDNTAAPPNNQFSGNQFNNNPFNGDQAPQGPNPYAGNQFNQPSYGTNNGAAGPGMANTGVTPTQGGFAAGSLQPLTPPGQPGMGQPGIGQPGRGQQPLPNTTANGNDPWLSLVFASLVGFGSVACNFFLGWSYLDARHKYQSALRRTVRTFSRGGETP